MCLSPITIINPTKFVSTKYKDRFLLQVPCSKCSDCQRAKSNEWLFRTWIEFQNCIENRGFAYFDTLTYSPANLPTVKKLVDNDLPAYPCFSSSDINRFFKRLRINLTRKFGDVVIRYLLTSEYGSKTARPHYHILFFVVGRITPLQLSVMIDKSWQLGRTDGYPYQSALYVNRHNVLDIHSSSVMLKTSNYVTKYVQKDCHYQKLMDLRVKQCDLLLTDKLESGRLALQGVEFERMREKVRNCINQLHRQSLGFGELALRDLDLKRLFEDGAIFMPHPQMVKMPITLPVYYKRKLFYYQVEIAGSKSWVLSEFGKSYNKYRDSFNMSNLKARLLCMSEIANMKIDASALADYILHRRGRYRDGVVESDILERINDITHYVYSTRTDKLNIGCGVSLDYHGNVFDGYSPLTNKIKFSDFISKHVYLNQEYEDILEKLYASVSHIRKGKQAAFQREQELRATLKLLIT